MQQRFDERNRNLIVNVAGRLVHRDEAGVSPFDSAVQGGDAVWEGLRLYSGRIFRLEQHLDRLVESARRWRSTHLRAPRSSARSAGHRSEREPALRRRRHTSPRRREA